MGLDMSLEARVSVYGQKVKSKAIKVDTGIFKESGKTVSLPTKDLVSLMYDLGSWHKTPWIHRFFVTHVQDGKDDCGMYGLDISVLRGLRAGCTGLLHDKSKERAKGSLISPVDGVYCKTVSLDDEEFWEEYWKSLEYTVKVIDKAIAFCNKYNADLFYSSTW